ncbi:hypothetical protein VPNG_02477 [Cytospora leucostoma]|uniref:Conserved oligomeric Golgi complex subunit 2 n=1 Tax=Cytospora leucostoma TaxID=1230097 RepID=A0A423XHV8_9PEZI|nr:hypothetical protein VPNG_02477 [Cytospora leucostoma]
MATGLGITTPDPRPSTGNSSKFQLPSSSPSSTHSHDLNDDDDFDPDAPLPFPTALSRNDFLAPDFNAATYLSSLFPGDSDSSSLVSHRHQTLEDLRTELRERSSAISAELLELVNANYTSFLGLGDELKGGGERVEDVRVALLGFRRQVEEVQSRVRGRREDVQHTGTELRTVRGEIEQGRKMLELDERCEVLLSQLEDGPAEDEDDDGGDEDKDNVEEERLAGLAHEYNAIERLVDIIGRDLPYVRKLDEKIIRCRNTLLLDLGTATREARKAGEKDRTVKLLGLYRQLGAYAEGVKILKEK